MSGSVRKARLEDIDRVEILWSRFLDEQCAHDSRIDPARDAPSRFRADFPEWLHDRTRLFLVAERDQLVAGFASAALWSMPPIFVPVPELFVEYLYVDPEFRRAGIGRQFVTALSETAASWGVHRIRLAVIEGNTPGRAFWSAVGATTASCEMVISVEPTEHVQPAKRPIGFSGNP